MNDQLRTTRRGFLGGTAVATAAVSLPWIVSSTALGLDGATAPSDKITLGVIGVGPRCKRVLGTMLPYADVQCVAIADVQKSRRNDGKKLVDEHYKNHDCVLYRDFREILARKDIDAVLIATGDRWHAPISMLAAEAGKDIYSEKPCGITIALCQELDETIRRTGRIFQAGTQRRDGLNFQTAVRMAQSGKLGTIHTLYASSYVPELDNQWLPIQATPPRDVVDWNLWLGPAPWRPFNKKYVSGGWRGYYDFDSGAKVLDWGAHTVDLCQWANNADDTMPIKYEPSATEITCHYADGVKLVIDFVKDPFGDRGPHWITRLGSCPVRFAGDKGWVETGDTGEMEASTDSLKNQLPTEKLKGIKGLDVAAHTRNFFDCVKSRKPTSTNSQIMRHSHLACHAAAISWILNRKLTFDPKKEEFVGDDEANSLRSRAARTWGERWREMAC